MKRYLLDTNIIVSLWENDPNILEDLIKNDKARVVNEVLNELSVKETKLYRRREVLSERFCKLLNICIDIEKANLSGFYFVFDCEIKGKYENNNLSENDLLQIYSVYIDKELILVTEDKELYNIGKHILGEDNVMNLKDLEVKEK